MRRLGASVTLGAVLAGLAATLMLGLGQKAPCASGNWGDLRQYRQLCYSDIVPLYATEQLQGDRLPYLDDCQGRCDEYPVLTMYAMRLAAWPVDTFSGFFYANALLLILAAGVTAFSLWRMAGRRALYFALAPSLLIYGFVNWDLIAVMFATAATLAFLRKRDVASGILLGLGASAKLYPALLLLPFVAERFRRKEPDGGIRLVWAAAVAWLVVDLPFMVGAFHGWSEFFRFNASRVADWDSLWFMGCHHFDRISQSWGPCVSNSVVNPFSVVAFVGGSAIVWAWKVNRHPATPRWMLGFPILVAFLLANKVYSPQYGLWLLPWFPLVLPELRLFLAFEAADVAVFVTRFAWFGDMVEGSHGWVDSFSIGFFEIAVLVRAAILVACVVRFVQRPPPGPREPVREMVTAA